MCHTRGCSLPGTARPVLELRPRKDRPGPRLRFGDDVVLCEGHRATATVDTFLSPEGYDKICKHLREAGKRPPARKNITLCWEATGRQLLGARVEVVETVVDDPGDEGLAF